MDQRTVDAAAIEAEVDHVRSLGIDALRKRWRLMFGATPPKGLTKDITTLATPITMASPPARRRLSEGVNAPMIF